MANFTKNWDPMAEDYNTSFNSYNRDSRANNQKSSSSPAIAISLYVTGLSQYFDVESLRNLFSPYGKVLRCFCSDANKVHQNKYGFVNFGTLKEAEEAISRLNNKTIESHIIKVELSRNTMEKLKKNNTDPAEDNYKSHPDRGSFDSYSSPSNYENGNQCFKSVEMTDTSLRVNVKNFHAQNDSGENLRGNFNHQQEHFLNIENDPATTLGLHLTHLVHGNDARAIPKVEGTPQSCEVCGNLAFFRCAQCKCTWYCCQGCQYDDWSDHRKNCLRIPIEDDINVIRLTDVLYPKQKTSPKSSPQPLKHSNSNASSPQPSNQAKSILTLSKKMEESPNVNSNGKYNRKGIYNHNAFQEPPEVVEPLRKPNSIRAQVPKAKLEEIETRTIKAVRTKLPKQPFLKEIETPKSKPVRTTLPKQPVLKENDAMAPVFCINPWDFYIQRFLDVDVLNIISSRLNSHPLASNSESFAVGSFCAAKFFTDKVWYRGKIEKIEDSKYSVYFVDFGNREMVEISDLKLLPQDLYEYPEMAFHAKLIKVKPPWDSDSFSDKVIKKFQELIVGSPMFLVKESYQNGDLFQISLVDEQGLDISDFLVEPQNKNLCSTSTSVAEKITLEIKSVVKPLVEESSPIRTVATSSRITWDFPPTIVNTGDFRVGDDATLYLVWKPESKGEICCWLFHEQYLHAMQDIERKLQLLVDKEFPRPKVGEMFATEAIDGAWYRAVAKEVDDQKLKVMFVDYGNEEYVKKIKKLPQDDMLVPSCLLIVQDEHNGQFINKVELNTKIEGKIAALAEKEVLIEWNDQGSMRRLRCYPWFHNLPKTLPFESIALKQAKIMPKLSKRVLANEQNAASNSYIPNFDENAKIPTYNLCVNDNNRVSVVWVSFPNQVYVQKESEQDKIKSLMKSIAIYCEKCEDKPNKLVPKVGTYVCAQFTDKIWYRALVISKGETLDKVKVLLVDYGNEMLASVEEILPLPLDAYDDPPFAYIVTLDNVTDISPETAKILSSKEWRLKIVSKKVTFNKCVIKVRLYEGAVCINDDLKIESEKVSKECQPSSAAREDFVYETINSEHLNNLQQVILADDLPKAKLEVGDEAMLRVTNVFSPNFFFCSNSNPSATKEFEHLCQEVQKYCEKTMINPKFEPVKDQAVLTKNTADDLWHRAVVLENFSNEKESSIFFIDDGKFDRIPYSKLLALPAHFAIAPIRAIIAALYDIIEKDEWEIEIQRQFKSIIKRNNYLLKGEIMVYDKDNDTYHVKIPSLMEFLRSRDLLQMVRKE